MVETRSGGRAKALLQRREQEALPSPLCEREDSLRTYFRRCEVQTDDIDLKSKVFILHNLVSRIPLLL